MDAGKKAELIAYINKSFPLQSLLYNLNLLPELCLDTANEAKMLDIASHFQSENRKLEAALEQVENRNTQIKQLMDNKSELLSLLRIERETSERLRTNLAEITGEE